MGFLPSPRSALSCERQRPRASSNFDSGSDTALAAPALFARLPIELLRSCGRALVGVWLLEPLISFASRACARHIRLRRARKLRLPQGYNRPRTGGPPQLRAQRLPQATPARASRDRRVV